MRNCPTCFGFGLYGVGSPVSAEEAHAVTLDNAMPPVGARACPTCGGTTAGAPKDSTRRFHVCSPATRRAMSERAPAVCQKGDTFLVDWLPERPLVTLYVQSHLYDESNDPERPTYPDHRDVVVGSDGMTWVVRRGADGVLRGRPHAP